jgi:hypothetical protein
MPILGVVASSVRTAADTGAMFPLQVVTVGAAGATSITFSNIPGTYTHLQLRSFGGVDTVNRDIYMRFNNDTASNYSAHLLYGTGSSAAAYSPPTTDSIYWSVGNNYGAANSFGAAVADILDYANTNKYKTVRSLYGYDNNNTTGQLNFASGNWRSTSAITSITIFPQSGNIIQYSSFALYAVKGA